MDENNLSEGELELSEAVISVNQYIMPRFGGAGHFDRNLSASSKYFRKLSIYQDTNKITNLICLGIRDTDMTYPLMDHNASMIASNVSVYDFLSQ